MTVEDIRRAGWVPQKSPRPNRVRDSIVLLRMVGIHVGRDHTVGDRCLQADQAVVWVDDERFHDTPMLGLEGSGVSGCSIGRKAGRVRDGEDRIGEQHVLGVPLARR